jgi:hypothetical protein
MTRNKSFEGIVRIGLGTAASESDAWMFYIGLQVNLFDSIDAESL